MTFKFEDQLSVGANGESLFLELYPWLNQTDGIIYDFERNGKGVELKTDTYSMDKTPNFFMEKHSDCARQTLGGPWRAARDDVAYFVYMYVKHKKCYWFDPKTLIEFLDVYTKHKPTIKIPNRTWVTEGYLVPRDVVQHLVVKESP